MLVKFPFADCASQKLIPSSYQVAVTTVVRLAWYAFLMARSYSKAGRAMAMNSTVGGN